MKQIVLSFAAATLIILQACTGNGSRKAGLSPESLLAGSARYEKDGWIFLHLEGSADKIGYQHGYQLASEIIDLRGALSMLNNKTTGRDWDFYRNESYRLFWPNVPEEYRKEMEGIVTGANARLGNNTLDIKDIVAINSILEMSWYYVPWLEKQENPTPPGHCSAIAATGSWTTDGKIVMAHNNWVDYVVGERWNIILDIVPEKGNRIIMDALPGFIHSGDDFYINSQGLIVTETTITQFKGFDTTGVAEFIRVRNAIQYSSTIDEWVEIMKKNNNGGYANDWLIGDNKTGEIARLELGLKNQFLERTTDGVFTGANYPVNEKLIKEETTYDPSVMSTSPNARKVRWEMLMKEWKGKINVESAKTFMGDHFDTWRNKNEASGLSLCGHIDRDATGAPDMGWPAFSPAGAVQSKATDGTLASKMEIWAIIGHPCGEAFIADDFLQKHPEFSYQKDFLRDMPSQKWTTFASENR
jgi:hypothetical protein